MIYLHLDARADADRVGGSRLFGYPDLTPDIPIPAVDEDGEKFALTFICQINLADLPKDDPDAALLPATGLLLFFADIAYYRGDWDEPAISMHPSNTKVVRVIYIPEEDFPRLENQSKYFYEQDEAAPIALSINTSKTTLEEPDLQLLGTTDRLEWKDWPKPCAGWRLLFLMDSMEGADYNYNFVDWGALCFLISPHDLARRDFSRVRGIILSS